MMPKLLPLAIATGLGVVFPCTTWARMGPEVVSGTITAVTSERMHPQHKILWWPILRIIASPGLMGWVRDPHSTWPSIPDVPFKGA